MTRTFAIIALLIAASARLVGADPLISDDTFDVRSHGDFAIDGGFVAGFPAALPTGMSTGVGAGVTWGGAHSLLAWGARASWTTATESTTAYTVTQSDLRLRASGALQHAVGRATLALRLDAGPTIVHETRLRTQGERAGLMGSALETTAFDTLPAADLEAVIALHVAGPWLLAMSGGPSFDILDGSGRFGWTAELGIGWQP